MMTDVSAGGPQPFALENEDVEPAAAVSAQRGGEYSSQWPDTPVAMDVAGAGDHDVATVLATVGQQCSGDQGQQDSIPVDGMWL